MVWTIGKAAKVLGWRNFGWNRKVPRNVVHGAKAGKFGLFLNIEKWTTKPTSAALDFHLA